MITISTSFKKSSSRIKKKSNKQYVLRITAEFDFCSTLNCGDEFEHRLHAIDTNLNEHFCIILAWPNDQAKVKPKMPHFLSVSFPCLAYKNFDVLKPDVLVRN